MAEQHHTATDHQAPASATLRQRIGRDNLTQSSVIATKRLDEALLRLDRAAGRQRPRVDPSVSAERISSPSPPSTAEIHYQRFGSIADLEVDDSVKNSTVLWLETEDHQHRMRVDPPQQPVVMPRQRKSEVKPLPEANSQSVSPTESSTGFSLEELFARPIDVLPQPIHSGKPHSQVEPAAKDDLPANPTQTSKLADSAEVVESKRQAVVLPDAKSLVAFEAAWQVDAFLVPEVVDELFIQSQIADPLATRMFTACKEGLQTLSVTSVHAGEGRSTVAMGIAVTLARKGLKVALVDADAAQASLAADLCLDLDHGWVEAIRESMPLQEVAVASKDDSFTLFPLKEGDDDNSPTATDLNRILSELKEVFDLVIIDGRAACVDDAVLCDSAVIVRDVQRTQADALEAYSTDLRQNGLRGVGVIENFSVS